MVKITCIHGEIYLRVHVNKNVFANSFASEHSKHFFCILRKKLAFFLPNLRLPLTDASAKNAIFLARSLLQWAGQYSLMWPILTVCYLGKRRTECMYEWRCWPWSWASVKCPTRTIKTTFCKTSYQNNKDDFLYWGNRRKNSGAIAHFIKPYRDPQCNCKLDFGKVLWNGLYVYIYCDNSQKVISNFKNSDTYYIVYFFPKEI